MPSCALLKTGSMLNLKEGLYKIRKKLTCIFLCDEMYSKGHKNDPQEVELPFLLTVNPANIFRFLVMETATIAFITLPFLLRTVYHCVATFC